MNILFVRMSYIGDIMHATPTAKWIKEHYPHAKLHWIVTPRMAELLEHNPYVDEIILWDRESYEEHSKQLHIRTMWNMWWQLRKLLQPYQFDVAVDVQGRLITGLVLLASGAPIRLGLGNVKELNWMFTNYKTTALQKHVIYKYLDVAKLLPMAIGDADLVDDGSLGVQGGSDSSFGADDIRMVLNLTSEENDWAAEKLSCGNGKRIVLAPGTSWPSKVWHEARWVQLIKELQETHTVVLLGGKQEAEQFQSIVALAMASDLSQSTNLINLMGQTTLRETAAIMSRCQCVVAGDTGVLHMASALGIPVVGLFGPTNSAEWGPLGSNCRILQASNLDCLGCRKRKCHKKEHLCMDGISVEQVLDSINTVSSSIYSELYTYIL